jgi:chromosome segregation ATPase
MYYICHKHINARYDNKNGNDKEPNGFQIEYEYNVYWKNMKIWDWIFGRKRLREENEFLRGRIKALEKKEQEMQCLNVNLKREIDSAAAKLSQRHTKELTARERTIKALHDNEERLQMELEKMKQTVARYNSELLEAKKEIKELRCRTAQLEAAEKQAKGK